MIERLLVKDSSNTSDPKVRTGYAMAAGVYGIISNFLIGGIKLLVGLITHSIGIMADAVNSLADCASCCLTIFGFKLASRKPDSEHPYGHARYEYLFGFVIGIVMLITGGEFAVESIKKIIKPQEMTIIKFTYISMGLSILVKFSQFLIYRRFGKIIDSNALRANASDARNDTISSLGLLVAIVVMDLTGVNIDGYMGLVLSVFIIINSFGTIKEQIEPLIGIKPTRERVTMIKNAIMSFPGVLGIHDLVIHNYGVHNDFVTVHVEMDSQRSFLESHSIADQMEEYFRDELGINITIHMDPVVLDNPKLDSLLSHIAAVLNDFDPDISFHDVRMVDMPVMTKVMLDCVFPPEKGYTATQLSELLEKNVKMGCNLMFIVEVDVPFS